MFLNNTAVLEADYRSRAFVGFVLNRSTLFVNGHHDHSAGKLYNEGEDYEALTREREYEERVKVDGNFVKVDGKFKM